MTPKEKHLLIIVGAVAALALSIAVIFLGKKSEVEEFKKSQSGRQGRISAIREAMKSGGEEESKEGQEPAPASENP